MSYINPEVFDQGLDYADANGTRIDLCTQEPTTYSQATTKGTYSCGYKTGLNTSTTANGGDDGRKVTVPSINDGTVDCTGSVPATHWALTDGSSIFVAAGALSQGQTVTDGNTFTLDEITITIRDPA